MTVRELYEKGFSLLKNAGIDDCSFELSQLFEAATGYNKIVRVIEAESVIEKDKEARFLQLVSRRINGEPLQYILGKWEFMGFEFAVGEGVLIPRPETELLVENAVEYLKSKDNSVVYDLCAGSGAIGLSIAKLCRGCEVYLFEKYDGALEYLKKNAKNFGLDNVHIIKADIKDGKPFDIPSPQLIVSNPPYIKTADISSLQSEVLREPLTALDGGEDGLYFYRIIHDKWLDCLSVGGMLLVECADNQSKEIIEIYNDGRCKCEVLYDFNNIDRAVRINV